LDDLAVNSMIPAARGDLPRPSRFGDHGAAQVPPVGPHWRVLAAAVRFRRSPLLPAPAGRHGRSGRQEAGPKWMIARCCRSAWTAGGGQGGPPFFPISKQKWNSPVPRRPNDRDQYRLDFESRNNERFARLVSALERCQARPNQSELVRLVFNLTKFSEEPLRMSFAELARRLRVHRNTARNLVQWAARLGLLLVARRPRARGGTQPHELLIDWKGVDLLCRSAEVKETPREDLLPAGAKEPPLGDLPCYAEAKESRYPRSAHPPPGDDDAVRPAHNFCAPAHKFCTPAHKFCAPHKGIHQLPFHLHVPPPPPEAPASAAAWQVVVDFLKTWRVGEIGPAIEAVRTAGGTPEEALAICHHWEQHLGAWGVAALVWRLKNFIAGEDPASRWPPESARYAAGVTRQRREAAQREAAVKSQAHRQRQQRLREVVRQEVELLGGDAFAAAAQRAAGSDWRAIHRQTPELLKLMIAEQILNREMPLDAAE